MALSDKELIISLRKLAMNNDFTEYCGSTSDCARQACSQCAFGSNNGERNVIDTSFTNVGNKLTDE